MYQLTVEGMRCGGCARRVSKSIQGTDADANVTVDLETKQVRIDSTASLDSIQSAITQAGYSITESANTRHR